MTFFSKKMISVETRYKTYNRKLLAIMKTFKTWRHYLKSCKYKVLVLTDYNNFYWFMNTKNLSFRQVHQAQKLSQYYFQIDYCQGKANEAADTLFCFFQKSFKEKEAFQAKNTKILHCL